MPVYEYTCSACQTKFDHLARTMSASDSASTERPKCPACGSTETARVLSVFAVGSEQGGSKSAGSADGPMCGRCGGPGPCAMD